MSIELMIRAHNAEDLHKQLADLLGAAAPSPAATVMVSGGTGGTDAAVSTVVAVVKKGDAKTTPKVEEPKVEAPKVEEVKDETPVAEETLPELGASENEGLADDPTILTYDNDIKPAVLKVSAKQGRAGVEKLLASFGVGNAKEVPEEKWAEFLQAIDKALEG